MTEDVYTREEIEQRELPITNSDLGAPAFRVMIRKFNHGHAQCRIVLAEKILSDHFMLCSCCFPKEKKDCPFNDVGEPCMMRVDCEIEDLPVDQGWIDLPSELLPQALMYLGRSNLIKKGMHDTLEHAMKSGRVPTMGEVQAVLVMEALNG